MLRRLQLMRTPLPIARSPIPWLRIRRRPKPGSPESWNLTLLSANTGVPIRLAAESPTLMLAAVEDLCWRLAAEELRSRRPHWWRRRALDAWRAERVLLDAKRSRIAELTAMAVSEL